MSHCKACGQNHYGFCRDTSLPLSARIKAGKWMDGDRIPDYLDLVLEGASKEMLPEIVTLEVSLAASQRENQRLREVLKSVHQIAVRALAEPPDGTGVLIEICTVTEETTLELAGPPQQKPWTNSKIHALEEAEGRIRSLEGVLIEARHELEIQSVPFDNEIYDEIDKVLGDDVAGAPQPTDLAGASALPPCPRGITLISAERCRQINAEGWTAEHDDEHDCGELLRAARCYLSAVLEPRWKTSWRPLDWPWNAKWWKPLGVDIRNLVKAGALIAAEIDRLSRIADSLAPSPQIQPKGTMPPLTEVQLTDDADTPKDLSAAVASQPPGTREEGSE